MSPSSSLGVLFLVLLLNVAPSLGFSSAEETRLRSDLFTGYDHEVRPDEVTKVELHFNPTSLNDINIKTGIMKITGWWIMHWNDSRLVWAESNYSNIAETHVFQDEVWNPPIIVYNSIDNLSALDEDTIPLRVHSDGNVTWSPPGILSVSCTTDITYFPFDTQTCGIEVTTFGYTISELEVAPGEIETNYYSESGEWILERTSTESNPNLYSYVTFKFQFKRKPDYYGLNLILPVIMLWLLSVFIFLLPAESGEKMGYSLTVLLAFVVLMTLLADVMPTTADHVSLLEVYIILVLAFCGMSVGYSIISLALYFHREDVPVPDWLQSFTRWIFRFFTRGHNKTDQAPSPVFMEDMDALPGEGKKPRKISGSRPPSAPAAPGVLGGGEVTWKDAAYAMDLVVLRVYLLVTAFLSVIFLIVLGSSY